MSKRRAAQPPLLKVVPIHTKHTNGMTWTPLQLLEEFTEAIRTGKESAVMLSLHWMEKTPDGGVTPRCWQAGCSRAEQIAFLGLMHAKAIEDWRNGE